MLGLDHKTPLHLVVKHLDGIFRWRRWRFLNENFLIQTLHHNTSACRLCRRKIKIFLLHNSNPSYRLNLLRTWSVQSLLRFDNLRISQLVSSRKDTVVSLCARHYRLLNIHSFNLVFDLIGKNITDSKSCVKSQNLLRVAYSFLFDKLSKTNC